MTFDDILEQVLALLKSQKRVSYGALKMRFEEIDDKYLDVLKEELFFAYPVTDENDRGLVWNGNTDSTSSPHQSIQPEETESRFHVVLPAVIVFLQQEERVTYRILKDIFGLNDGLLADIRKELQFRRLAIDEDGEGLVWTRKAQPHIPPVVSEPSQQVTPATTEVTSPVGSPVSSLANETEIQEKGLTDRPEQSRSTPEAENRQLTVMFCDLADSTRLSQQLDPEDLREVVRAYQETAAAVIDRYDGHIAQYLGDGLLIYLGWPQAHENDAERAVYIGLEIPQAISKLNQSLQADYGAQLSVRIGIHTGPVVVGEMGGGGRYENLALGETPNIAARLEGLAQPNTVVISPATAQLVQRSFILEELGEHELKGVAEPMMLYIVVGARETAYDDHEEMLAGGFDALVGRDEEIGLLLRRWEQSKDGQGQVVLISGEAGLGKSSLVEGLRAHVRQEGYTRITFRCSPYTTNSAMHPVIEHVQRVLGWQRDDSTETKLDKLEQALQPTSLSMEETVPLLATLLSLPVPEDQYPALTLSPQRQRQLTQDALVAWMLEEAEHQPVLAVWEDLHWGDPSTLELLGLFIEQTPTVPMLNVLAFRPEFVPPWPTQSHMTPITLNRLERLHIEELVRCLAGGKQLPQEVETHIVTKTDGIPLYVEELTKMLLESDLLEQHSEQYVLTGPLSSAAIPDSLQSSLLARLDRLPTLKEVAQLGAVLGREFDYEMLHALTVMDESTLQKGLSQLVTNELLYQRGRIPRAKFIFRHVLIRDAAYTSLLRRTRQQYHQRIAQTLEAQFPETSETRPELVAHHYTEADLPELAIGYWQRAGERASERSAHQEAMSHLTTGLNLLQSLPETSERHQQELPLQTALGTASLIIKGHGALETETAYTRARVLCQALGDTQDVFPVLLGLWRFYVTRSNFSLSRQLGEELLGLAERRDESSLYVVAHSVVGTTYMWMGELVSSRRHMEAGLVRYAPVHRSSPIFRVGQDPGVACRALGAWTLWLQGYPNQALVSVRNGLALATELNHPFSEAFALGLMSTIGQLHRKAPEAYDHAESAIRLSTEQGFPYWLAQTTCLRGWALTALGQGDKGLVQMQQGLTDLRSTGAEVFTPYFLTLLAEGYAQLNRVDEGLDALLEGAEMVERMGTYLWKAEVYRLQGQLLLARSSDSCVEAESCFHQALEISRHQEAKSLELRASTSLARLWQSQDKRQDAYDLLAPVYNWFTEGFDTADLIDAKALLVELEEGP